MSVKLARRRGVSLLWTAIFLTLLLALGALGVEVTRMVHVASELQLAADSAALAAAQWVREDVLQARTAAVGFAAANRAAQADVNISSNSGNDAAGDVVIGWYDRDEGTFTPGEEERNAVKVTAHRTAGAVDGPLPLLFGDLFGVSGGNVSRSAIAMIGGGTGAGLLVLSDTDSCALDVRGSSLTVAVNDGAIQVNSAHGSALCHSGSPTVQAEVINVVGSTDGGFEAAVNYDGEIKTSADPVPDPLAFLPAPSYSPSADLGTVSITGSGSITHTINPGYYSGGISMSNNNGRLVLNPGIYILDGVGLSIRGGDFIAEGVMLYIVDSTPSNPRESCVYLGGNGTIRITPPDPAEHSFPGVDVYAGVAIFQARSNTNDSTFVGNGNFELEGTYYFPENHVDIGGTSLSVGNQFISDTVRFHGTGTFTVNYDGRFPATADKVFLIR